MFARLELAQRRSRGWPLRCAPLCPAAVSRSPPGRGVVAGTPRVALPGFACRFNSQRFSCSRCPSHFNKLLISHCLFSLSAGLCSIFAFSALLFVLISMCLTYIFVAICPVITTAVPAASLPSAQPRRGNPPCLAKGWMLRAPARAGISLQTQAGDATTLRVLEKGNKDEEAKERARATQ